VGRIPVRGAAAQCSVELSETVAGWFLAGALRARSLRIRALCNGRFQKLVNSAAQQVLRTPRDSRMDTRGFLLPVLTSPRLSLARLTPGPVLVVPAHGRVGAASRLLFFVHSPPGLCRGWPSYCLSVLPVCICIPLAASQSVTLLCLCIVVAGKV
jgi:hypothetical protein